MKKSRLVALGVESLGFFLSALGLCGGRIERWQAAGAGQVMCALEPLTCTVPVRRGIR